ncbi:unnamed protein product [Mytilus coruscus]|uniref:Uncharacterized protein n=1 Tax=Mytilus coruscus TaxID=42192 RepID=A0A6J8BHM3_MYTCO|nr:unnamed protein product [Mytilus coruscus]
MTWLEDEELVLDVILDGTQQCIPVHRDILEHLMWQLSETENGIAAADEDKVDDVDVVSVVAWTGHLDEAFDKELIADWVFYTYSICFPMNIFYMCLNVIPSPVGNSACSNTTMIFDTGLHVSFCPVSKELAFGRKPESGNTVETTQAEESEIMEKIRSEFQRLTTDNENVKESGSDMKLTHVLNINDFRRNFVKISQMIMEDHNADNCITYTLSTGGQEYDKKSLPSTAIYHEIQNADPILANELLHDDNAFEDTDKGSQQDTCNFMETLYQKLIGKGFLHQLQIRNKLKCIQSDVV